jgi:hypothetical protein
MSHAVIVTVSSHQIVVDVRTYVCKHACMCFCMNVHVSSNLIAQDVIGQHDNVVCIHVVPNLSAIALAAVQRYVDSTEKLLSFMNPTCSVFQAFDTDGANLLHVELCR